ncbi:hypothetical protein ZWY2020_016566 [Hordeum vulgare]|nr:hypothetical protein ZWY2020_016566 [Hordeum vulgare]
MALCMTGETDLMCELLKHGATPFDDMIQHSSVIRMYALGLMNNLKGHQSIAPAAAMVCVVSACPSKYAEF